MPLKTQFEAAIQSVQHGVILRTFCVHFAQNSKQTMNDEHKCNSTIIIIHAKR